MTGLQVWLHPSSRTKISCQLSVKTPSSRCGSYWVLGTSLYATPFRRTAAVVRNRRGVFDRPHFDSGRGERTDCRLATGARSAYPHIDRADSMIARHAGGVRCGLLRGERSAFTRATKAERPRTFPRQHIAGHIGNGDDGVVERSLHVHQSVGNVLALFLLERFLLAFFLGRRSAACYYWFCHF